MAGEHRRRGRLRPEELAEAAVLGDVALILTLGGWWLPLGYVLYVAATVPFAALVVRRRLRAAVIATVAAGQVAFLMGGLIMEANLALIALAGITIGVAYRRGWGDLGAAAPAPVGAWLPPARGTVGGLAGPSQSRPLPPKPSDNRPPRAGQLAP